MWSINSLSHLYKVDKSIWDRAMRKSLLDKVIDTFRFFSGKRRYRKGWEPMLYSYSSGTIGASDYLTLGIFRFLEYGANYLYKSIFDSTMHFANSIGKRHDLLTYPLLAFYAIFAAPFFIFRGISVLISAVLTLISLPAILVVHAVSQIKGYALRQEFLKNYHNQGLEPGTYENSNPGLREWRRDLSEEISDGGRFLLIFGTLGQGRCIEGSESDRATLDNCIKPVNYSESNRIIFQCFNINNRNLLAQFSVFKHNQAGRAAFLAFRKLNIGNINATYKPSEQDKKIKNLIGSYVAMRQVLADNPANFLRDEHKPSQQINLPSDIATEIALRTLDDAEYNDSFNKKDALELFATVERNCFQSRLLG